MSLSDVFAGMMIAMCVIVDLPKFKENGGISAIEKYVEQYAKNNDQYIATWDFLGMFGSLMKEPLVLSQPVASLVAQKGKG